MTLEEAFQDAVERVSLLPKQPNHTLLKLYGMYKQATTGDVSGSRPGAFDMRGRAKYDAWSSRKGTSQEDAMTDYIEFCDELGA